MIRFHYRCSQCNKYCLFGTVYEGELKFCSYDCYYAKQGLPDFCEKCQQSMGRENFPGTYNYNLIGTAIAGNGLKCPDCHSFILTIFIIFFMPIFPKGSYRVMRLKDGSFLGRRVNNYTRHWFFLLPAGAFLAYLFMVFLSLVYDEIKTKSSPPAPVSPKQITPRPKILSQTEISELIKKGKEHFNRKDYKGATDFFSRIVTDFKNQKKEGNELALALFFLGKIELATRNLPRAATFFSDSLAIKENFETCYYLGGIFLKLKRFEKGLEYTEKGIALKPKNGKIHQLKGNILFLLNKKDEAEVSFMKAKQLGYKPSKP